MTSTLEIPTAADAPPESPVGSRRRFVRPTRHHVFLGVLLIATAVTYLWNITSTAWATSSMRAQRRPARKNWEALLFGSVDPHNFITVDKPPVSQWVMGLSGQIFGFSSASMLVPEALMAVASVALLYGAVARIAARTPACSRGHCSR